MDQHAMDAKIDGYEALIPTLTLSDPKVRRVLAAATHSYADVIVTINLRGFPRETLTPDKIEVIHPDDFTIYQIELNSLQNETVTLTSGRERPRSDPLERRGHAPAIAAVWTATNTGAVSEPDLTR